MELREMIESAANIAGSQAALAKVIGVRPDQLTHAKAARAGLPAAACYQLAHILSIDPAAVVAASELVTEKNPEKRAVFAPFVLGVPRTAAAWILGIVSIATIGGLAPTDANASDSMKESSKAANALPASISETSNCHYVNSALNWIRGIAGIVRSSFAGGFGRFGFVGW